MEPCKACHGTGFHCVYKAKQNNYQPYNYFEKCL
jgi:hypothetical protein